MLYLFLSPPEFYLSGRLVFTGSVIKERVAMFLSALELRNIIESSFLPKRCQCTLSPELMMTIKVFADERTDQLDFSVTDIDASQLNGCREINELIARLRTSKHPIEVEPRSTLDKAL